MKREDAFDKYISTVFAEGADAGHATAMATMLFACSVMMIFDIISKNKNHKTAGELCENSLNDHVYIEEDEE